jgi:hypothetical protein
MKTFLGFGLVISLIVSITRFTSLAEENPEAIAVAGPFPGKILVAYLESSADDQPILRVQNANLVQFGEKTFLRGIVPDNPDEENDWTAGAEVFVAMDRIESIFAFTPEQYQRQLLDKKATKGDVSHREQTGDL